MFFRRIVTAALAVSLVTGLAFGLVQHFEVSPLIYAAESFEGGGAESAETPAHGHDAAGGEGHSHGHGDSAWAPADGAERITYTVLSDVFVAFGFSVLLLVGMAATGVYRGTRPGPARGALWGIAGFATFFAAPSLGLPPELPGMQAAALGPRQLWWLATAGCTAAAIGLFVFARGWKKAPGLVLLAIPHVVGAPHPESGPFAGKSPATAEAMSALHDQFILATALTNAGFWLLMGLACGWAVQHWVLRDDRTGA